MYFYSQGTQQHESCAAGRMVVDCCHWQLHCPDCGWACKDSQKGKMSHSDFSSHHLWLNIFMSANQMIFTAHNDLLSPLVSQWAEYVLFASLLVVVCVIFSFMAYFYTYINPAEIEAKFRKNADDDEDDKSKQKKPGFQMAKRHSDESHIEDVKGKQTRMWTHRINKIGIFIYFYPKYNSLSLGRKCIVILSVFLL